VLSQHRRCKALEAIELGVTTVDEYLITAESLKLYQVYNIRYLRPYPTGEKIVTARALFLGLFNNKNSVSSDFLAMGSDQEPSTLAKYFGLWFLTYCPVMSADDIMSTIDSFEFVFCHPEKGMSRPEGASVITIQPPYSSVKTMLPQDTVESKRAFEKLKIISKKTGLIDVRLDAYTTKSPTKLTNTVIRNLHRGLTKLVEKA
jgi:hypothetical protein